MDRYRVVVFRAEPEDLNIENGTGELVAIEEVIFWQPITSWRGEASSGADALHQAYQWRVTNGVTEY